MATLDYGTSTSIDPYADYEWYGQHKFYAESDVTFGFSVDITNPLEAERAVNAVSVKNYVDNKFATFVGAEATWDIKADVSFTGPERVYFQLNPFLGEAVSLWDIQNLSTYPDQIQLSTPAALGDVKDYVDQNLDFAVTYVLGEIDTAVTGLLQDQLPDALAIALDFSFDARLNYYAANVLYPEIDTRIEAAVNYIGDPSVTIANEINAQLPNAIAEYSNTNILPILDGRDQAITEAYTLLIEQAFNGAGSSPTWSQDQIEQFAAGVVVSNTPAIITEHLVTSLPPVVTLEVERQLNDRLASEISAGLGILLPDAVSSEVTYQLSTTLEGVVTESVDANLAASLAGAIQASLDANLDDAIGANLNANLDGLIQANLDATLPIQIGNSLSSALDPTYLWSLLQSFSLDQVQGEIGLSVPALVQAQVDEVVNPLVEDALDAQLGDAIVPKLEEALDAMLPEEVQAQVFTNLSIALADGGMITNAIETGVTTGVEQYFTNVIEPDLDNRVTNQFNALAPDLISQGINTVLDETLVGVVQLEIQNALQPELDQLTGVTVPNVVGIQLAEKLPDMVTAQLFERFGDARMPQNRRFEFTQPSSLWVIEHNMNTVKFMERLYNGEGKSMFANIDVINETSFVVRLTQAMVGWVDVEFFV